MTTLEQARNSINKIDVQMASLFVKRMEAVSQVLSYKQENNLPVFDAVREAQVIENNTMLISDKEYKSYYHEFINNLMDISKQYQRSLLALQSVGFQGTEGAYSHIALTKLFKDVNTKEYVTFEQVFEAVLNDEICCGIVPFENSYTGEVGEVLDLLFKYNCHIQEIYDLKIEHNLLGVKGAKLEDIKQVFSHHQAISQCKQYLDTLPVQAVPYHNTALAAKYISEYGDISKAAIASIETAQLYNLTVLAKNVNTSAENTTRFIVISKQLRLKGARFNMMFTLEHNAGQLARAMQIIGNYGFNMESVKSKSLHNLPWQYYFYVELVGDGYSKQAIAMREELGGICKDIKLLGVY